MNCLLNFFHLSRDDRCLTLQALFELQAARLGLRLFPFRTMHNWTTRPGSDMQLNMEYHPNERKRVVRAILRASRFLPGESTCLPQAMATHRLLAQRGIPATFKIGVRKEENKTLSAHAWVECDGQVVIGGPGTHTYHYTPLPHWEELDL